MKLSTYRVTDGESFSMRKQSTDDAGKCKNDGEIDIAMTNHITELIELQNKLYADNHYGKRWMPPVKTA
jgi:hypothetical protein